MLKQQTKLFEVNKAITPEVVSDFVKFSNYPEFMQDINAVYQECKRCDYIALKRLTSICIMSGNYSDYEHLLKYWKVYVGLFQISLEEK